MLLVFDTAIVELESWLWGPWNSYNFTLYQVGWKTLHWRKGDCWRNLQTCNSAAQLAALFIHGLVLQHLKGEDTTLGRHLWRLWLLVTKFMFRTCIDCEALLLKYWALRWLLTIPAILPPPSSQAQCLQMVYNLVYWTILRQFPSSEPRHQ